MDTTLTRNALCFMHRALTCQTLRVSNSPESRPSKHLHTVETTGALPLYYCITVVLRYAADSETHYERMKCTLYIPHPLTCIDLRRTCNVVPSHCSQDHVQSVRRTCKGPETLLCTKYCIPRTLPLP